MREIKNGIEGDTKINCSFGGFPAPGASPQLDRFTSVLPNLIQFSSVTWLVQFTDVGIFDLFSVLGRDSAMPAQPVEFLIPL